MKADFDCQPRSGLGDMVVGLLDQLQIALTEVSAESGQHHSAGWGSRINKNEKAS